MIVAAAIPPLFYAPTATTLKVCAFVFGIGLGGDYMIIPLMAAELYGVAILGRVLGIVLTADSVAESLVPMLVAGLHPPEATPPGSWCWSDWPRSVQLLSASYPAGPARSSSRAGRSERHAGAVQAAQRSRVMASPSTSLRPSRLFDLTGRVAVVVGGTSGIGRAIGLGLADAGADVVATGAGA